MNKKYLLVIKSKYGDLKILDGINYSVGDTLF